MANSVDQNQNAPIGAVCSWSKLFASILNSSVMLGNYLQQTTPADDTFSGASCLNSGLHLYLVYACSKGSGESTHLHRLTCAFIS